MSLKITDAIACPRCGTVNPTGLWTSVNGELDPELKQTIVDGTLFLHPCEGCKGSFEVAQSLLYHDMRRTTLVQLLLPGDAAPDLFGVQMLLTQAPGVHYKLRLVGTYVELVEKIAILDAGLDDRLVEAFKFALREKLTSRGLEVRSIRYLRKSPDAASKAEFRVEEADGSREVAVPFRKPYDDLRSALKAPLTKESETLRWRVVDARYVAGLLEEVSG